MTNGRFQTPRGTVDILPEDQPYWDWVRATAQDLSKRFSYRRIDTPVFEDTALFVRTVGEGTDIVEKEMYTFHDRGDDLLTLRPEGTAPVCRAYIQHGMHALAQPVRLYYTTPIFRYERPQAGRFRQHWQFGAEAIGDPNPEVDAEVIHLLWSLLTELGLKDLTLHLNSIGDVNCRPAYLETLKAHYADHLDKVCDDCRVRYQKNPLRLLDCKQDRCQSFIQSAPALTNVLCDECSTHFAALRRILDLWSIPYQITPRLVRGLDYYTRTVFEVHPASQGSQTALGAGGRYDGLMEQLGGRATPGVGFGSGIERIILNLKAAGLQPPDEFVMRPDVFVIYLGDQAQRRALERVAELRREGQKVQISAGQRSLRAQLRAANQSGAGFALIIGEDEIRIGEATIRDLITGNQIVSEERPPLHAESDSPQTKTSELPPYPELFNWRRILPQRIRPKDHVQRREDEELISLIPGWNLISIPGVPEDKAVTSLVSGTSITQVWSYNSSNQVWEFARLDSQTDSWEGTLKPLRDGRAYFVRSSTFDPLSFYVHRLSMNEAPRRYQLRAGWNAIGFTPRTGQTTALVTNYLDSLKKKWEAIRSWNQSEQRYETAWPDGSTTSGFSSDVDGRATMESGKGYLLYLTANSTLSV